MEMKERVVYYARTNRKEKDINEQIDEIKSFIDAKKNMQLVGGYTDENKSGVNISNRIGLLQMLKDMTAHKFDAIIVKDISRISRNVADNHKIYDELVHNKIKVISLYETMLDSKRLEAKGNMCYNGICK